jgi:hypothetical protein
MVGEFEIVSEKAFTTRERTKKVVILEEKLNKE